MFTGIPGLIQSSHLGPPPSWFLRANMQRQEPTPNSSSTRKGPSSHASAGVSGALLWTLCSCPTLCSTHTWPLPHAGAPVTKGRENEVIVPLRLRCCQLYVNTCLWKGKNCALELQNGSNSTIRQTEKLKVTPQMNKENTAFLLI